MDEIIGDQKLENQGGFEHDVKQFSSHCAYIRTVFTLMIRIWRDSSEAERSLMEANSPSFFLDLGQVLGDFAVLSACRITDPANTGAKNENFTVEFFLESFPPASQTYSQLEKFKSEMEPLRTKIIPARNKLVAHADREVIRKGKPLGYATWEEWNAFWSAVGSFINVLNEKALGTPFDIEVAGVPGDAEMLLKALRQSQHFETLMNTGEKAVQDACLKLAIQT